MAEVTALRNNPSGPVYGLAYGITFAIRDAAGVPITGAAGLDSEVSKGADTAADCTNEATEIATATGLYYLLLTAAEMTASVVTVKVKSSSTGAQPVVITLYPEVFYDVHTGTSASLGSLTNSIILDSLASNVSGFYNGCLCVATIDSNVETRVITAYNGATKAATVVPDWNVAPDNNDTFAIKANGMLSAALRLNMLLGANKQTFNRSTGLHTVRNAADTGDAVTMTVTDNGTITTIPAWT